MFRRLSDFTATWAREAATTLQVLEAIPEADLDRTWDAGGRSARRLGWHLVETLLEMPRKMGLETAGGHLLTPQGFIQAPPPSGAAIAAAYREASDSLLALLEGWTDADLEREDALYGFTWARGFTLFVLVNHQAHHRGQMTVLARQAGAVTPAVCGPAREGWAQYGVEPPAV